MPDNFARKMRRAYLAAIAYTDSLVGRMVAGVEAAGMTDDTIVTFVGGESRTLWWSEKFRFGADTAPFAPRQTTAGRCESSLHLSCALASQR